MDITRRLPEPLPENWSEVRQELQILAKKYDINTIATGAASLVREGFDIVLEAELRTLFDFAPVKKIHVAVTNDWNGGEDLYVYVDTEPGNPEEKAIQAKLNDIMQELGESRGSTEPIPTLEDFKVMIDGAPMVIIERTST